jgi:hypothetical protein
MKNKTENEREIAKMSGYFEITIMADENGRRNEKGERFVKAVIPVHHVNDPHEASRLAEREIADKWPGTNIWTENIVLREYNAIVITA